jgi:integrase
VAQSVRYSLNKNKYLLDQEIERLEHILKSFKESDPRNATLLELALRTGARASELLMIRAQDLDDSQETVFLHGLKGSNDRELPIPAPLFKRLRSLSPSQGLVFPISYNRLRQIWELYRPVNKTFHCLRHTFAIRLYKKTKDIRLVQFALGHRNIANTMIYAEYVYSQQELRKILTV